MAECTIEELRATEGCPANTTLKALNWAQLQMLCSINDWLSGVSINECDFEDLLEEGRCSNASVVELEYWQSLKLCELVTGLSVGGIGNVFPVGTPNFLPKWSATTPHLTATSLLYDNGTSVGLGTALPVYRLDIVGTANINARTIAINATPVVYFPDQTPFFGSMAFGNGLRLASHTNLITGQYNTAVGIDALLANTTGWFNTAIGYGAMAANTTGVYSVAIGQGALHSNTTGVNNTAVGVSALYNNTTANYNVAVGLDAMQYNITGEENVSVGKRALFNGSGSFNTCVGNEARIGGAVENGAVSGDYNTVVGHKAMIGDVAGSLNTSVGAGSMQAITNSTANTAIGRATLLNITSGNYNVALGGDAGRLQSDGVTPLTTATTSVYIGYNAQGFNNTDSNTIVIGAAAKGNGTNSVVLGNDSITTTILKGKVGIGFTGVGTALQNKLQIKHDTTNFTVDTDWAMKISDPTEDVALIFAVDATNDISLIQSTDPGTASTTRPLCLQGIGGKVVIGATTTDIKFRIVHDTTNIALEADWGIRLDDGNSDTALAFATHATGNYAAIQSFDVATSWATRPLCFQPNGGGVVIGGVTRDASAKLQIDSIDAFLLPPRMTKAQRDAVAAPANGSVLYQTDGTAGLKAYVGGAWYTLNTTADP